MDIKEFFQQSEGKWLSQRTSHHLAYNQSESGKSELRIELLPNDHPEILKLCEQHNVSAELVLCSARIISDGTMEWDKSKCNLSTLLVLLTDLEKPNQGKLLRELSAAEKSPSSGRYFLGNDDVLTLITEQETMYSEERLWFASPNLRLRTSVLKSTDSFSMASFCSEIRMGVTAPAKS